MAGSIPPTIAAEAILIMAGKTIVFLAPFFVVAALWWIAVQADRIVAHFFPLLQWEKDLGWLNLRAERRARAALRWMGFAIYLLLALTLLGIPSATKSIVDETAGWPNMPDVLDVIYRLGILIVCSVTWLVFLGCWLIPKIRREREIAGLKAYRARVADEERERERRRPRPPAATPLISIYQKPRTNAAFDQALTGRHGRHGRDFPPGG